MLGLVLGVGRELGSSMWMVLLCSLGALVALKWLLQNANSWYYETPLGEKKYSLPPGDLGWPFIGNMWSFLRAFKSSNPEAFLNSMVSRFTSLSLSLSRLQLYVFSLLSLGQMNYLVISIYSI